MSIKNCDGIEYATPWAVYCNSCGLQFLTQKQYTQQLMRADSLWRCPVCGDDAYWDDECPEINPIEEDEDAQLDMF